MEDPKIESLAELIALGVITKNADRLGLSACDLNVITLKVLLRIHDRLRPLTCTHLADEALEGTAQRIDEALREAR